MSDTEMLTEYLRQFLISPGRTHLDTGSFSEEYREFAESLKEFCGAVAEIYEFSAALADGNLDREFDGKNPLIGSLKELQAGLRHFSWQIKHVAMGDYSLKAEFLGEFSDAFNEMTRQLIHRKKLMIENHKLEMKLEHKQKQALEEQLNQQRLYYSYIKDMNEKTRAFRHDTNNYYLVLDSLLAHGDVEQARSYLSKISVVFGNHTKIINTDNLVFDALMTEKILAAVAEGIEVEKNISISPNAKVEDFDWSVLIGNAMDNAIEASSAMEDGNKKININITKHRDMLNVEIKNTAHPPKKDGKGAFLTSKSDKENHGFGLKNIKRSVEKYNGVLETYFDDGYFVLRFMLCGV